MKTLALLLLLVCPQLFAVTLAWDQNPEPDIDFYFLHVGTNSGHYLTNYIAAKTNIFLSTNATTGEVTLGVAYFLDNTNLFSGTNFFVVTAVNTSGLESDFSNEISFIAPVTHPRNFRIKLSLETSSAIDGPWNEIASIPYEDCDPLIATRFYRGRIAQQ